MTHVQIHPVSWKTGSVVLFLMLAASVLSAQNGPGLVFSTRDQFDSLHTEHECLGSVTVVFGTDHAGSKYNAPWSEAVRDSLRGKPFAARVKFLPVANVSSVPFFLKGYVKGQFPRSRLDWVLLDWDGHFADTYHFVAGDCNVVVFDRLGSPVFMTHGQTPDARDIGRICRAVEESLQAK